MIRRAFLVVAAILGPGFSLPAREMATSNASLALSQSSPTEMVEGRPALGRTGSFRALPNMWYGNGPLTLVDGRLFSFPGAFGWVEATQENFLPAFSAHHLPRVTPVTALAQSTGGEKLELFPKPDYVSGEVSVFYGRSTGGKYSREVEQGSILGEIVNGNTRIQVGGFYGHSSGNSPRIIGR